MKPSTVKENRRPSSRDEDFRLDELLASLPGEGWKIALSEVIPGEGEKQLGSVLSNIGDLVDYVGSKYGCGEYTWQLKRPDGRWASFEKDGVVSRGRFSLSPKQYPKRDAVAQDPAVPAAASSLVGSKDIFALILQQQQQSSQQMMTLFTTMMDSNTKMMAALISRPGPDPVDQVAKLHAISGGAPAAGVAGIPGSVAQLRELVDLGRELTGGGKVEGDEGGKLEVVARICEALSPVVESVFATRAPAGIRRAPPPPQAALPRPVDSAAPAAVESQGEGADVNFLQKLKVANIVKSLIPVAQANKDPLLYADLFLDQAGDLGIPLVDVKAAIFAPDLFDQLSGHFPEMVNYKPWFDEYLTAIRNGWGEVFEGKGSDPDDAREPKPAAAPAPAGSGGAGSSGK